MLNPNYYFLKHTYDSLASQMQMSGQDANIINAMHGLFCEMQGRILDAVVYYGGSTHAISQSRYLALTRQPHPSLYMPSQSNIYVTTSGPLSHVTVAPTYVLPQSVVQPQPKDFQFIEEPLTAQFLADEQKEKPVEIVSEKPAFQDIVSKPHTEALKAVFLEELEEKVLRKIIEHKERGIDKPKKNEVAKELKLSLNQLNNALINLRHKKVISRWPHITESGMALLLLAPAPTPDIEWDFTPRSNPALTPLRDIYKQKSSENLITIERKADVVQMPEPSKKKMSIKYLTS